MKYPYNVYPIEASGHSCWAAESLALKGCVGQGDDPDAACAELGQNENTWLDTAKELGIPIPERPGRKIETFDSPSLCILARDPGGSELPGASFIVKNEDGKTLGYGRLAGAGELYLEDGTYTVFLTAPDGFAPLEPQEVHIVDSRKYTTIVEFFAVVD